MESVQINCKRISVAMCTFNGAKYLSMQLDSILKQTVQASEIIIVDDGSTDNTLDIIKDYSSRYSIIKYYVNNQNVGYVRNFSIAISKTSGDYVALADQDDIWMNNHLEKLMNGIGEKAVCVGDAMMIDAEGKELGMKFSEVKQNYYTPEGDVPKAYRIIYNASPYQGASMLVDRQWVNDLLPFPSGVGFHDTFLSCCACLTKGLAVIPDVITRYRIHQNNVTTIWRFSILQEIKRRKHFVCYSDKPLIIDHLQGYGSCITKEGADFIEEFRHVFIGRYILASRINSFCFALFIFCWLVSRLFVCCLCDEE